MIVTIDPVSSIKSPDLPPAGIGATPLHVLSFTASADFQRIVVQSVSNGSRIVVIVPYLRLVAILGLNDKVSALRSEVKVSALSECCDNVEVFSDSETTTSISISSFWLFPSVFLIDDYPSLRRFTSELREDNLSVLSILTRLYFNNLL